MPVTSQVTWPAVPPGSRVDVAVVADPSTARIHADGEHRFEGKPVDHAGHSELCPGPRGFPLVGAGLHTIDIRVINFEPTSTRPLVTATLLDASGEIVDGPVPCQRTVPANDHYLVTILGNLQTDESVATPAIVRGVAGAPVASARPKPAKRSIKKKRKKRAP